MNKQQIINDIALAVGDYSLKNHKMSEAIDEKMIEYIAQYLMDKWVSKINRFEEGVKDILSREWSLGRVVYDSLIEKMDRLAEEIGNE